MHPTPPDTHVTSILPNNLAKHAFNGGSELILFLVVHYLSGVFPSPCTPTLLSLVDQFQIRFLFVSSPTAPKKADSTCRPPLLRSLASKHEHASRATVSTH